GLQLPRFEAGGPIMVPGGSFTFDPITTGGVDPSAVSGPSGVAPTPLPGDDSDFFRRAMGFPGTQPATLDAGTAGVAPLAAAPGQPSTADKVLNFFAPRSLSDLARLAVGGAGIYGTLEAAKQAGARTKLEDRLANAQLAMSQEQLELMKQQFAAEQQAMQEAMAMEQEAIQPLEEFAQSEIAAAQGGLTPEMTASIDVFKKQAKNK